MERLLAFSSFADESKDWGDYFMLDFSLQKKNKATNNVTVIRKNLIIFWTKFTNSYSVF